MVTARAGAESPLCRGMWLYSADVFGETTYSADPLFLSSGCVGAMDEVIFSSIECNDGLDDSGAVRGLAKFMMRTSKPS